MDPVRLLKEVNTLLAPVDCPIPGDNGLLGDSRLKKPA
jgi:hypothetical protein